MPVTIDLLENVMFREAYERAVSKGLLKGIEQGIEQGMEQGIEKGVEQGVERGHRDVLLRQLERRFGPLSPTTQDRLNQATGDDILRWTDRILDAPSLEAVFE